MLGDAVYGQVDDVRLVMPAEVLVTAVTNLLTTVVPLRSVVMSSIPAVILGDLATLQILLLPFVEVTMVALRLARPLSVIELGLRAELQSEFSDTPMMLRWLEKLLLLPGLVV